MASMAASIGDLNSGAQHPAMPQMALAGLLVATPFWLPSLRTMSETAADLAPIVGFVIGLVTLAHALRSGGSASERRAGVLESAKEVAGTTLRKGGPLAILAIAVLAFGALFTIFAKPKTRHESLPLTLISPNAPLARKRSKDDAGGEGDAELVHFDGAPPWFDFLKARIGQHEGTRRKPNPVITKMFEAAGFAYYKDQSAVPWCSIGLCGAMELTGTPSPKTATARDWLEWGKPLDKPQLGCVVVIWRKNKNSVYGHVFLYAGETADGTQIIGLGCNQSDAITVEKFPKSRVLGYRWPRKPTELRTAKGAAAATVLGVGAAAAQGKQIADELMPLQEPLQATGTPAGVSLAAWIGVVCALLAVCGGLYALYRRVKDHEETGF